MNRLKLTPLYWLPILLLAGLGGWASQPDLQAAQNELTDLFTVRSTDGEYNSALIGNGEVVTMIGPTGYHSGLTPEDEYENRTFFWAGRRLADARTADVKIPRVPPEELIGATIPLIRLGRIDRTLTIDGEATADDSWAQRFDPNRGMIVSTLEHGDITERTESFVTLNYNMAVFHTTLQNTSRKSHQVGFVVDYVFGDSDGERAEGTRLHIRRPYPTDLGFGNVEGVRSLDQDLATRPPDVEESLIVQYEIEDHLGEVHLGRYPVSKVQDTDFGGRFTSDLELEGRDSKEIWVWMTFSDRRTYTHYLKFDGVQEEIQNHLRGWEEFWGQSNVTMGNPKLDAIYKAAMYTMRCNASPWTIPPGYLSTHWEGRIFHDEYYPFMAMISSNHAEIAYNIPNHRLSNVPVAEQRSAGHGTHFGWEVTETGEESAPYGHWVDEQFPHGQISEQAWQYYLYTKDLDVLERFYPVIKGCAEWMIYDVLARDAQGRLKVRVISDIAEGVITAKNTIFAAAAAIRSLENAARAAEMLGKDSAKIEYWRSLALELQENLPVDTSREVYKYADDTDIKTSVDHLGMIYPFPFDVYGDRAQRTLEVAYGVFQNEIGNTATTTVMSYNWSWAIGRLSTLMFYSGYGDKGYAVLERTPITIGPFMVPNEHYRKDKGAFLPWFTTGSGAWVYAVNAMFVQVRNEGSPILLPAIPSSLQNIRCTDLLATRGVTVSSTFRRGKLVDLTLKSPKAMPWKFRIPASLASNYQLADDLVVEHQPVAHGLVEFSCRLKAGDNSLLK